MSDGGAYFVEVKPYRTAGEFIVCLKRKAPKRIATVSNHIERNRESAEQRAAKLSTAWFNCPIVRNTEDVTA
jgi:hypothetical protein